MKKYFYLAFLTLIIFSSCSSKEEIVYFQNLEKIDNMQAIAQFEPRIEINDVLNIQVSSLNEEVVRPFQLSSNQQGGGGAGGNNQMINGYLVGVNGAINFPVLGEVDVLNMSRSELEKFLTNKLKEFVTDVVVRVRIMNFKVTVMGETGSSVVEVQDGRISVPQVIAMSGDITYDGKRDNILVIRNLNGKISYGRVDLTDADVFQNPFFYLKQNDIIYVEPTYRKVKSAGFITSWQGLVSIITTAFSLFVLFNNI
ncbi:polysaccharide biosynthesis/export family protein [Salinimicrobium sp. GXAS 041]|uniref:polysaccharide biosynthesis/export family protein n=1 Tax=Salinimicrobium sp. GXAS 041 TaxID=3400806 RepID=UPI003C7362FA